MAKKVPPPMKVVNKIDYEALAKEYAKKMCFHDDYETIDMQAREYKDDLARAFFSGTRVKGGEWKWMSQEKPEPYKNVICMNSKCEAVIGYFDKERGGMVIYGHQLYNHINPADFGEAERWKVILQF